ncbi:hypothetical protein [Stenotrophomonas oahuensis]|uniref:Uncharacterized protein n=1 Tax=Stenotrophomonas oahuensis TaxID=3003271 RepID=A0ABY9YPN2_9GAMM|nr:hypothetical protein [Stenotrophomonas sp. A5586]WNH52821.1 hypothetical protein PDM29_00690 [Stenotrophomonas sp. A5586]
MPASYYTALENDAARQDDELCRSRSVDPDDVSISNEYGEIIHPISELNFTKRLLRDYLMICFSSRLTTEISSGFSGTDACLIVHDPDALLERIHAEVERALPGCITVDAPVSYGLPHGLGVAYSKPTAYASQCEYRLTASPPDDCTLSPLTICIGSIETIAEVLLLDAAP